MGEWLFFSILFGDTVYLLDLSPLSSFLLPGALLEKKTDLDKRGMGMSDYSNGMNKPMVCRPSALSKDPCDRTSFLDKVRYEQQ